MPLSIVGESVQRVGAVERVSGSLRYSTDVRLPGMLHMKLVCLDCGRGKIRSIDTSAARALPGVRCVLTAADLPQPVPRYGPVYADRPVLATGETKFYGEPVAAVAADDEDIAAAAAALIRVDYEELPAILSIDAALAPGAPLVQEPDIRPDSPWRETNVLGEWKYGWGDPDLAQAAIVLEHTYTFPMVSHFAIEPHTFLAAPDGDGITVWSPVQHPFILRRVLATVLGFPLAKVRVIVPDIGGGFGGKGYPKLEPLVAIMALQTGRPVRLALTLEEAFLVGRRASSRVRMRTGFGPDGYLVFQDVQADYLVGAYADSSPRVVSKASYLGCGAYRVSHARFVGRAILSHTVPSTAFRGFGAPQLVWAVESQMDEAARRLGIDRVEIRLRNLPARGEVLVPGDTPVDGDWREGLAKASRAIGWGTPLPPHRGRGVAIGIKSPSPATVSHAIVRLHQDGSASVYAGTTDMGQGSRTVFTQLVAEVLNVPADKVAVVLADTGVVPFDPITASSRSTVCMGNAVMEACQDIMAQLKQMASELYTLDQSEVTVADGAVHVEGKAIPYAQLLSMYYGPGMGEVIGRGTYRGTRIDGHPLGGNAAFWEIMFTAAEVEVDEETGQVVVTKLINVGDVGKVINPRQIAGQDEGGAVMALGQSLMEHIIYDRRGRMVNAGALDYRIPTIKDVPEDIVSLFVENQDGPGPFGSKGAGESSVLATTPAVASAVTEATGVVFRDLPLTPERVWLGLRDRANVNA